MCCHSFLFVSLVQAKSVSSSYSRLSVFSYRCKETNRRSHPNHRVSVFCSLCFSRHVPHDAAESWGLGGLDFNDAPHSLLQICSAAQSRTTHNDRAFWASTQTTSAVRSVAQRWGCWDFSPSPSCRFFSGSSPHSGEKRSVHSAQWSRASTGSPSYLLHISQVRLSDHRNSPRCQELEPSDAFRRLLHPDGVAHTMDQVTSESPMLPLNLPTNALFDSLPRVAGVAHGLLTHNRRHPEMVNGPRTPSTTKLMPPAGSVSTAADVTDAAKVTHTWPAPASPALVDATPGPFGRHTVPPFAPLSL